MGINWLTSTMVLAKEIEGVIVGVGRRGGKVVEEEASTATTLVAAAPFVRSNRWVGAAAMVSLPYSRID
jgi:hypothetical protein